MVVVSCPQRVLHVPPGLAYCSLKPPPSVCSSSAVVVMVWISSISSAEVVTVCRKTRTLPDPGPFTLLLGTPSGTICAPPYFSFWILRPYLSPALATVSVSYVSWRMAESRSSRLGWKSSGLSLKSSETLRPHEKPPWNPPSVPGVALSEVFRMTELRESRTSARWPVSVTTISGPSSIESNANTATSVPSSVVAATPQSLMAPESLSSDVSK
mmetsp:Transcript_960/g.1894  ORF Transcript_960/g.1894 Transcript_960/m.1894 type:complete len:213 (+) Transcript_960:4250-4888(+)